jgi:hypothetical protein
MECPADQKTRSGSPACPEDLNNELGWGIMMDDHMNDFSGIPDDRKDFKACGRH